MEHSKLPKPTTLRPPQIIVSNIRSFQKPEPASESKLRPQKSSATTSRPPLEPISETKLNKQKSLLSKQFQFPKYQLRRRSKSVTDLRAIVETKPLVELKKTLVLPHRVTKLAEINRNKPGSTNSNISGNNRVGVKRPAEKTNGNEVKPKVPKVKIPDWDYKSRFNHLNEKHTQLQDNFKDAKRRLSDLSNIEEEFNALREEAFSLKTEKNSLTEININMTKDIVNLKRSNQVLESNLSTVNSDYEKLQEAHAELQSEHKSLEEKSKTVMQKLEDLQEQLDTLEKSHEELVKDHNKLTNSYNLLKLEYDTEVREKECLQDRLTVALERIEKLESETKKQKGDIIANENLRRQLHNTVQDLKGNIRVFCRVRPPVTADERDKMQCYMSYSDECSIEIRKSRESVSTISGKMNDFRQDFTFDLVFSPESTQQEVFAELAQLIQSALDGYNVCVFAYGQTGSGKTFTMQGEAPDELGMIPRSVDLIFDTIEKLQTSGWEYTVEASFLEIYNETVKDLLEPNSKHSYDIRFNEGKGMTVTNLKIVAIKSAGELKNLMNSALRNRAVASTDFNEHSSRSHAVTKIYLQGYNAESHACYCGSVNLVDLAGSESAKTSSTERLTETKNINKSLSTLGSVMLALHNKDPHVPYRNSKLTYLLQSCLGGNSKTLMFVNISPFDECYNESVNSLRFASKVKEVKTGSKRNKNYVSFPLPVQGPAK